MAHNRKHSRDVENRSPEGNQNRAADIGLTLGLLSILLNVLTAIPAIIFGIIGIGRAKESGNGRGRAIAGIAAGIVGSLVSAGIGYTLYTQYGSKPSGDVAKSIDTNLFQYSNENLERMIQLKQIGALGESNFPAYTLKPGFMSIDGQPIQLEQRLMSWRVSMLAFLSDQNRYIPILKVYNRNEAWNSVANHAVTSTIVPEYCDDSQHSNETRFRVFTGPDTAFPHGKPGIPYWKIPDGHSNTAILVESSKVGPWTEPRDVEISKNSPLPTFGSPVRDTFLMMTADGAIRAYKKSVDEKVLRALIGINDGLRVCTPDKPLPDGVSPYLFNLHAKNANNPRVK